MSKNIFTELKTSYGYLTRVERILSDAILSEPHRFVTLTMAELSRSAGVSQGSINNFARKFSHGGFSALKLRVASCLSSCQPQSADCANSSSIKGIMRQKLSSVPLSFSSAVDLNEERALQSALQYILRAQKLVIYGVYHSGIAGRDLCYRLIQLGIPATFVDDTLMCAVSAATLGEQDLVIAISSSGQTSDIINAVEIAKENRVPILCLTCNRFSPLARLSDEVLISSSPSNDSFDRVGEIRMAQLFVIDTLCAYLDGVIQPDDRSHREKLLKIVSSHSIQD